jgi:eukaryotic-like serine/threonine-protein kinase
MSDDVLPDRSGEVIAGRFKLTKRLGAGGMGEVYKAVNEVVGREVAIKILKPEFARSPDVVQRVQREARAANVVRHTNIVDVLDVLDDNNGAPVIVQELLLGEDLASYVRTRGALSEAEALDLMTPVADALGAAHAAGIMHRDLKLENVFLDRRSGALVPKVLDFGLSRGIGESSISRLTATGVAMGTPMYMSPEQVQGQRDIDQRTDVWALGIMLYELVAGRLPFEGDSLGAIFVKVCTVDPPPLSTLAPGVSAGYVGVVGRCLQRDRTNRFEHAAGLAHALRAVRSGASAEVSARLASTVDGREQTLAASANSLAPAPSSPPVASGTLKPVIAPAAPLGARSPLAQSIGPAVSLVQPPQRRNAKVVVAAAAVVGLLVTALGWGAMRASGDASTAIAAPRAAVPPPAPAAPAAPVAALGTTQYDTHAPPPAPSPTPAYEPPPQAAQPAQPATTAYESPGEDPGVDARHARRARRGRARVREAVGQVRAAQRGGATAASSSATNPGTTEYDGN